MESTTPFDNRVPYGTLDELAPFLVADEVEGAGGGSENAYQAPTTDEKLNELLTILRPLAPFIAALPELMEKVDPLMEGLKTSPVLRMMGVKIP